MNQTAMVSSRVPPSFCSICGGKFGPAVLPDAGIVGMGQVLVIEGRVDVICGKCDLWLFDLVYNGRIGPIKEWEFKETQ